MEPEQTVEGVSVMNKNALGKDELVREYSTDGTLYVYRNGAGEHVVVSQGRENVDRWMETVPAIRTADEIDVGDSLWAVPDNWNEIVHVGDKTICEIDDGGYVEITHPKNARLRDANIRVTDVGDELVTEHLGVDWDWSVVKNAVTEFEDDDSKYGKLVFSAYTKVQEHTDEIEDEVAEIATEPWVMDHVLGGSTTPSYDSHHVSLLHAEIGGRGLIGDVAGLTPDEKDVLSFELTSKVTSPSVVLKME